MTAKSGCRTKRNAPRANAGSARRTRATRNAPAAKAAGEDLKAPRVLLPSALDMREVRRLKAKLEELYRNKRPCTIEAGEVHRASTGCLQILASFVKGMSAAGVQVAIEKPSAAFLNGIGQLGLSSDFAGCGMEQ